MNNLKMKYKSIVTMLVLPLLLGMCTKSDKVFTFTSRVITEGSSIGADQAATSLWFSTDDGATYSLTPFLSVGKKFRVKAKDETTGDFIVDANFFALDWSTSNPKPSDATADAPEFTMADNTSIVLKIVDKHCPTDPSAFTGDWSSTEVPVPGGCNCSSTEPQHIIQDSSNPNKLIMDNFFGDGVGNATVYFILSTSTTAYDQTLTVPEQVTEEGGTATGTGTYDQCRGTITMHVHYDQYEWIYNFERP